MIVYLHTNNTLQYKRSFDEDFTDYEESTFVKKYIFLHAGNKDEAVEFFIELLFTAVKYEDLKAFQINIEKMYNITIEIEIKRLLNENIKFSPLKNNLSFMKFLKKE